MKSFERENDKLIFELFFCRRYFSFCANQCLNALIMVLCTWFDNFPLHPFAWLSLQLSSPMTKNPQNLELIRLAIFLPVAPFKRLKICAESSLYFGFLALTATQCSGVPVNYEVVFLTRLRVKKVMVT